MTSTTGLPLDGNAAGGAFATVFAMEPTSAVITCRGCGRAARLAEQAAYVTGPGVVIRCPGCDSVLARLVHTAKETWLELRGSSSWRFPHASTIPTETEAPAR
jgi:hypothetical protein